MSCNQGGQAHLGLSAVLKHDIPSPVATADGSDNKPSVQLPGMSAGLNFGQPAMFIFGFAPLNIIQCLP